MLTDATHYTEGQTLDVGPLLDAEEGNARNDPSEKELNTQIENEERKLRYSRKHEQGDKNTSIVPQISKGPELTQINPSHSIETKLIAPGFSTFLDNRKDELEKLIFAYKNNGIVHETKAQINKKLTLPEFIQGTKQVFENRQMFYLTLLENFNEHCLAPIVATVLKLSFLDFQSKLFETNAPLLLPVLKPVLLQNLNTCREKWLKETFRDVTNLLEQFPDMEIIRKNMQDKIEGTHVRVQQVQATGTIVSILHHSSIRKIKKKHTDYVHELEAHVKLTLKQYDQVVKDVSTCWKEMLKKWKCKVEFPDLSQLADIAPETLINAANQTIVTPSNNLVKIKSNIPLYFCYFLEKLQIPNITCNISTCQSSENFAKLNEYLLAHLNIVNDIQINAKVKYQNTIQTIENHVVNQLACIAKQSNTCIKNLKNNQTCSHENLQDLLDLCEFEMQTELLKQQQGFVDVLESIKLPDLSFLN